MKYTNQLWDVCACVRVCVRAFVLACVRACADLQSRVSTWFLKLIVIIIRVSINYAQASSYFA